MVITDSQTGKPNPKLSAKAAPSKISDGFMDSI